MVKLKLNSSYVFLFGIIITVLFFRLGNINFFDGRYLWAEDGNIFINQALSIGIVSILTPYAGYLHLYPRLITLFAVNLNLVYLPILLFLGWITGVIFSMYIIFKWLIAQKINTFIAFFIISLILLQPSKGEVFFTITNIQWFLAIGLIIIIIDQSYKMNIRNTLILIVLGLTGPFSALFLPVLFLNSLIKKDLRDNHLKYILIVLTSLVQIYFMYESKRISGKIDTNIFDWLKSFYIFFTSGGKGLIAILSILISSVVFMYIVKSLYNLYKNNLDNNQITGLLLIFTSGIVYFAGLWQSKFPLTLSPMGGGNRYFFVPYALLVIVLPFLIKNKKILFILFVFIIIIDVGQFTKVDRRSLNFESYIWMSKYVPKLIIPINPQWSTYPGWYIHVNNLNRTDAQQAVLKIKLNLNIVRILNASKNNNKFISANNDTQIIFDLPKECRSSKNIGIEIGLDREQKGWSEIFFRKQKNHFSINNSLRRFYPAGNVTMQYAFENKDTYQVRIDPAGKQETIKMKSILLYCEIKKGRNIL
ncbi:hypothetical protein ACMCNP_01155 [Candidatus Acidulodesulfobacterium sp. H_13]|uniref:hypothetical protein n=1 Tax=Candidatus Acidulodesulfobacterium sp. H_13 TaxID=3395470 RepID=UPI003AF58100